MELKDFVRATLEQIVEGVYQAQESIDAKGGIVNPAGMDYFKDGQRSIYHHAMPQQVEFDVGLTSTDKSGSSEGIGVFLGSISLGKRNNSDSESVAVTKVKFSVPIVLPAGKKLVKK
ncbi:MAG: hypothetical protein Q7J43_15600 [Pseudomonas sp.]|uniref:hypothetical protein n=1 Tax=unclassified Pseudomonas TaxID=196821 RepID=UPI0023DF9C75|nr:MULTISPECIES: hypothetical protein [unclassified Pseudomonas]MDF3196038.1 hypothetical protein [Pseudomonas sp. 1928-m]MDO9619090.1 hypothetical protein [Pseudomonas sp.]MDP2446644.1 hypothetical protein [Pseudomonas sp.]MDZ4296916.1 hypothetical protein [Moraxellaceae bacterium]